MLWVKLAPGFPYSVLDLPDLLTVSLRLLDGPFAIRCISSACIDELLDLLALQSLLNSSLGYRVTPVVWRTSNLPFCLPTRPSRLWDTVTCRWTLMISADSRIVSFSRAPPSCVNNAPHRDARTIATWHLPPSWHRPGETLETSNSMAHKTER